MVHLSCVDVCVVVARWPSVAEKVQVGFAYIEGDEAWWHIVLRLRPYLEPDLCGEKWEAAKFIVAGRTCRHLRFLGALMLRYSEKGTGGRRPR